MHFITGGSTADQAAEGDFLDKDTRYERTREYIQIVKRAWTSPEPFDYDGEHYRFENFVADITPRAAAAAADLLRRVLGRGVRGGRGRVRHLRALGRAAGRHREQIATSTRPRPPPGAPTRPTLQIAFRPIIAPDRGTGLGEGRVDPRPDHRPAENGAGAGAAPDRRAGERRLAAAARRGRRPASGTTARCGPRRRRLTGGGGNSTALVGTPETVAAALLDYYDLGDSDPLRPRLRHLR